MAEYTFRTQWRIDADPDSVYAALRDVESYPRWWPQVVSARELDAGSGELRCRSMLPYDLVFVARREAEDPDRRVLRARLIGDLAGTTQWTIRADGAWAVAVFDEDVDAHKRLLRATGRLLRPALRLNHDVMMRAGERGLRNHLARMTQDH
jgi:uncharacterized protein YndB with AHSA1/START domain